MDAVKSGKPYAALSTRRADPAPARDALTHVRLQFFRLAQQSPIHARKAASVDFLFGEGRLLKQKRASTNRNQKLWAVSGHSGEPRIAPIAVST